MSECEILLVEERDLRTKTAIKEIFGTRQPRPDDRLAVIISMVPLVSIGNLSDVLPHVSSCDVLLVTASETNSQHCGAICIGAKAWNRFPDIELWVRLADDNQSLSDFCKNEEFGVSTCPFYELPLVPADLESFLMTYSPECLTQRVQEHEIARMEITDDRWARIQPRQRESIEKAEKFFIKRRSRAVGVAECSVLITTVAAHSLASLSYCCRTWNFPKGTELFVILDGVSEAEVIDSLGDSKAADLFCGSYHWADLDERDTVSDPGAALIGMAARMFPDRNWIWFDCCLYQKSTRRGADLFSDESMAADCAFSGSYLSAVGTDWIDSQGRAWPSLVEGYWIGSPVMFMKAGIGEMLWNNWLEEPFLSMELSIGKFAACKGLRLQTVNFQEMGWQLSK